LEWVGKTTYQSRIELTDAGAVAFSFKRVDGTSFWVAYSPAGEAAVEFPSAVKSIVDAFGVSVSVSDPSRVTLTGRPVYVECES
jgi:hypothetical protein